MPKIKYLLATFEIRMKCTSLGITYKSAPTVASRLVPNFSSLLKLLLSSSPSSSMYT